METDYILQKINVLNSVFNDKNKNYFVIKSNLMFKYQKLAEENGLTLDNGPFLCKWCLNAWTPGSYNVALQPQKNPKRHMRSLLRKDFASLNKFQQKLVSKIQKQAASNSLVFKCNICSKNTVITLKKPTNGLTNEEDSNVESTEGKKKKRRKKKDMFAGLNASVVKSYKSPSIKEVKRIPEPVRTTTKKPAKKLTQKQQTQIQQALLQTPVAKKRPSLLATFLDSM